MCFDKNHETAIQFKDNVEFFFLFLMCLEICNNLFKFPLSKKKYVFYFSEYHQKSDGISIISVFDISSSKILK